MTLQRNTCMKTFRRGVFVWLSHHDMIADIGPMLNIVDFSLTAADITTQLLKKLVASKSRAVEDNSLLRVNTVIFNNSVRALQEQILRLTITRSGSLLTDNEVSDVALHCTLKEEELREHMEEVTVRVAEHETMFPWFCFQLCNIQAACLVFRRTLVGRDLGPASLARAWVILLGLNLSSHKAKVWVLFNPARLCWPIQLTAGVVGFVRGTIHGNWFDSSQLVIVVYKPCVSYFTEDLSSKACRQAMAHFHVVFDVIVMRCDGQTHLARAAVDTQLTSSSSMCWYS